MKCKHTENKNQKEQKKEDTKRIKKIDNKINCNSINQSLSKWFGRARSAIIIHTRFQSTSLACTRSTRHIGNKNIWSRHKSRTQTRSNTRTHNRFYRESLRSLPH